MVILVEQALLRILHLCHKTVQLRPTPYSLTLDTSAVTMLFTPNVDIDQLESVLYADRQC
jgi:hypothetical protein